MVVAGKEYTVLRRSRLVIIILHPVYLGSLSVAEETLGIFDNRLPARIPWLVSAITYTLLYLKQ